MNNNLLCDVPQEVLRASIFSFCNVKDMVRLDTAVNNRAMKRELDQAMEYVLIASAGPHSSNFRAWNYFKKKPWMSDEFTVPPSHHFSGNTCHYYAQHGLEYIRSISFADCNICEDYFLMDKFLNYVDKLTKLDLSRCINTSRNLVPHLPNQMLARLTWLSLEKFDWADGFCLSNIADNCVQLQHLNISGSNIMIGYLEAKRLRKLTNLTYLGASSRVLDDEALDRLVRSCPKLTSLDISSCVDITDLSVETLTEKLPRLKMLNLAHCFLLTDKSVLDLAMNCTMLEELNVENCYLLTDRSLVAATICCKNLRSLNVSKVVLLTNTFLLSVCECARLRVLDVSGNDNFTDEHVILLAQSVCGRNLTSLSLAWCTNIGDAAVLAVAEQCVQLQHLNLDSSIQAVEGPAGLEVGGRTLVTATSVAALAERCTQFTYLNIANVIGIDDNTVATIASHCTKLESLSVYGCNRITDASIANISQHLRQLRTLDIACCRKLTSVLPLALNRRLEKLNMRGCWDAHHIKKLLRRLPYLTELKAGECSNMHDAVLAACTALTTLSIERCPAVSHRGVGRLLSTSHALRDLNISGCKLLCGPELNAYMEFRGTTVHMDSLQESSMDSDMDMDESEDQSEGDEDEGVWEMWEEMTTNLLGAPFLAGLNPFNPNPPSNEGEDTTTNINLSNDMEGAAED